MLRKLLGKLRNVNKLWLLLIIPLGLSTAAFSLPFVLIAMMMGTRLLSIFIGPVNIWNTPRHAPALQDVVGMYTPEDKSRQYFVGSLALSSYIKLNEDHTVEIHDMPSFDGFGEYQNCHYSEQGKWGFFESGEEVQITLYANDKPPQPEDSPCNKDGAFIELLGRHKPYRLYQIIGDPDSDTGITYLRR